MPRYPELVSPLRRAIDAYDQSLKAGVLEDEQLETIAACVCSPRGPLSQNAAGLLGELAMRFPSAAEALRTLSVNPRLHVRLNALVALESAELTMLRQEVLRNALADRSARVRLSAADKAMLFRLVELVPDLDSAIARESDVTNRNRLLFNRDLLRDGYHLERRELGSFWMTYRDARGGAIGSIVEAEEVERCGAASVARRLRGE